MKGFQFWLSTRKPIKNKIKKPEDIHEGDLYVDHEYKPYKTWGLTIMKNPAIKVFQVRTSKEENKLECIVYRYKKRKGLVSSMKAHMTKKQIFRIITGNLINKQ